MAFERTRQAQTGWAQKAIQRPTTNSQGSRVLIGQSQSQELRQREMRENSAESGDYDPGEAPEGIICPPVGREGQPLATEHLQEKRRRGDQIRSPFSVACRSYGWLLGAWRSSVLLPASPRN